MSDVDPAERVAPVQIGSLAYNSDMEEWFNRFFWSSQEKQGL